MEQVVVESIFKVDKATKAQAQVGKGFSDIGANAAKSQKQTSIFSNNLEKQVNTYNQINSRIDAYNKLLNKQQIGSEKFLATQKRIADLQKKLPSQNVLSPKEAEKKVEAKTDKPKEASGGGGFNLASKAMIGVGAAMGVAYGALAGIQKAIPAISQAIESMGDTITRNLFMPLAQEVYPLIMSMFQWVGKNRIVFVQLGTTFVQAFRLMSMAASAVLNLFKKFYGAFQKAIGGGQMTMQKFLGYVQLFSLKIAFIIAFLEVKLEGVMEFLGDMFGTIWKNAISPFLDGFKEGLLGSDGIFTLFDEFGYALTEIKEIFKNLGLTGGKENKTIQKGFKETGKFIGEFILAPFRAVIKTVELLAMAINWSIVAIKDLAEWIIDIPNKIDRMVFKIKEFGKSIKESINELKSSIGNTFENAFNIGKNLKKQISDAISNGVNDAWTYLKESKGGKAISWLMEQGQAASGFVSNVIEGAKAEGGEVLRGKSYLVGEKGAEIFTPKQDGEIIPNNQIQPKALNKIQTVGSAANGQSSSQYVDSRQFNFTVNGGNVEEIVNKVKSLLNTKPDFKQGLRESYARFQ